MCILSNFITYDRDNLSGVKSHGEYEKSTSAYNFAIMLREQLYIYFKESLVFSETLE